MTHKPSLTEFKTNFSKLVNSVGYGSDVVIVQKNNKNFFAVVQLSALSPEVLARIGINSVQTDTK